MQQIANWISDPKVKYSMVTTVNLLAFVNANYASWLAEKNRDTYHYASAILALLWFIASLLLWLTIK